MMSHVYSFFLFSLFLYILKIYRESKSMRLFILLSIIFSLVVLIRPTNIILGLLFFALDAAGFTEMQCRLKKLLEPAHILSFAAILSIVFLPQLVYWKYLSGNWLHFSYRDEGFTNLLHPEAAGVLFSPLNGLLAYTPMALIMLLGIAGMIVRKRANGRLIALVFIMVTMICASWKMWYFGCSFGQRSYIEYYAILAVPMGYFITWIFNMRRLIASTILLFVVFLFVYFNLRYTISFYRFERCYYGSTWDWDHYLRSVQRAGIISPVGQIKSFENDFENLALSPVVRPSKIFTCSGLYSISSDKNAGTTLLYSARLDEFGYPYPKMIEVEAWFLKPGNRITDASLSYTLNRGREILFSDDQPLDSLVQKPLTWSKVGKTFIIPDVNDSSLQINVFIKNPKHVLLFADDLKIKFRYHW